MKTFRLNENGIKYTNVMKESQKKISKPIVNINSGTKISIINRNTSFSVTSSSANTVINCKNNPYGINFRKI